MSQKQFGDRIYSRRDLLTKSPLAIIGGLVMGLAIGKPFISRLFRRQGNQEFPEGSIFSPAKRTQRKT